MFEQQLDVVMFSDIEIIAVVSLRERNGEKNVYFLKIPRRKFRVPFYLLKLNFRMVEFHLDWKVYFSRPKKNTKKIGDRKNKGNLWMRIRRHKTNYFTTESFLSLLRDVPGITERCSANLKRLSE